MILFSQNRFFFAAEKKDNRIKTQGVKPVFIFTFIQLHTFPTDLSAAPSLRYALQYNQNDRSIPNVTNHQTLEKKKTPGYLSNPPTTPCPLLGYCLSWLRALKMVAGSQDLAVEKTQTDGTPCACMRTNTHTRARVHTQNTHHQGVHPS